MVLAFTLTLAVCSILIFFALRRVGRGFEDLPEVDSQERAPSVVGAHQVGFGLIAFGLELILARGLAVRPPPAAPIHR